MSTCMHQSERGRIWVVGEGAWWLCGQQTRKGEGQWGGRDGRAVVEWEGRGGQCLWKMRKGGKWEGRGRGRGWQEGTNICTHTHLHELRSTLFAIGFKISTHRHGKVN